MSTTRANEKKHGYIYAYYNTKRICQLYKGFTTKMYNNIDFVKLFEKFLLCE